MVWFTDEDVVARAGADRYELGLGLYEQIGPLQVFVDRVVAVVGNEYQVRLTRADGLLIGECSCPVGRGGVFCEHCVAAAVMAADVTRPPDAAALLVQVNALREPRKLTSNNLERWAKDAEDLLLTLEEGTFYHPAITRPLYQQLLRHLVRKEAYLDTEEVHEVLMNVAEQTIAGLSEACLGEPMDPDELAGWVLDLQLEVDSHVFVDVSDLVEALGAQGVATYRRRLDELYRNLSPEDPYDEESVNRHGAIRYIREQFLLAFEPEVEVLSGFYAENPSRGADTSIAKALRSAGRIDEAISWLEGIQRRDYDGDNLLAELYELRGRHRDAARIRWNIFQGIPHQGHYRALLAAAEPLNAVEYAENRALSWLEGMQRRDYDGDGVLRDYGDAVLAELYELRGRHRDAARIRWNIFERVPHESHFQKLRERHYRALLAAAEPLNAVEYATNRAFAHLREQAARSEPGAAASLVDLLFAVGDIDQAWEAAREFALDRHILLDSIRSRIQRFMEVEDPQLVSAPEALQEATQLVATSTNLEGDLEVCAVVGWLYWCRYLVLDEGDEQRDFKTAVSLLFPVYQMAPDAVPQALRRHFHSANQTNGNEPPPPLDVARRWGQLAADSFQKALDSADSQLLAEGIGLARRAVAAAFDGHPDQAACLSILGTTLSIWFEWSGEVAALEETIAVGRRAVAAVPEGHPEQAEYLSSLGNALASWFEQTGELAALEEAVTVGRYAVAATAEGHPDQARYLFNLGKTLVSWFERTRELAVLEEAIVVGRRAVAAVPDGHPDQAGYLSDLGVKLLIWFGFGQTGELVALEEAISVGRRAVAATPDDHPGHAKYLSNLGIALLSWFWRTGELVALEEAIAVWRRAVAATPEDHPDHAEYLSHLGGALRIWFERTGEVAALEEAVIVNRRAVAVNPEGHPSLAMSLSDLGGTLQRWFGRTGELVALKEAIAVGRRAVAATPDEAAYLSNLGNALMSWFERTGEVAVLEEAIAVVRRAVAATSDNHPGHATYLSKLGDALQRWFRRTGELAALEESIAAARRAVAAIPDDHPDLAKYLSYLGGALQSWFGRTRELAAQEEAVAVGRCAVAVTPEGHPGQAAYLSNLGLALGSLFEGTGEVAVLEEAIAVGRRAVAATPEGHPGQTKYLSNLGDALWSEFKRTGEVAVLEEAIAVGRRAVAATPEGHPDQAGYLSNLGAALWHRFERTEDPKTLAEVMHALQAAAEMPTAAAAIRVQAGAAWGRVAMTTGQPTRAIDGFAGAVGLLPQLTARHLGRGDAQHWLGSVAGLAGAAAACALEIGDADRAVALLEQGRGVLLAQALESRSDLTPLRDQAPELADRFEHLCRELDAHDDVTAAGITLDPSAGVDPAVAASRVAERRRALAAQLDALITEVRLLPGLGRFLLSPPVSELVAEAHDGPVVLVNISQYRCDALILTPDGVRVVRLAELTFDGLVDQAIAFLGTLAIAHDHQRTDLERWQAEQTISSTLKWLWDTVTGPVLDALGITHTPGPDQQWPRLWWVPTGLLSFLPLHAAGYHHDRSQPQPRTVLDRVVSSYTPTVRALTYARTRRAAAQSARMLVVAMPHTPDAADLPGTQQEAYLLTSRFPTASVLTEQEATREAVLAALSTSTWAHFACHGYSDADNPSASLLLLHDHQQHPLSVLDISRQRLQRAELAYLSACSTTRTSVNLADEAIHITAAFQLVGYPRVIGTLWSIDDEVAVQIVEHVYSTLTGGTLDAGRAAFAVHQATRYVRDRYPQTPSLWAAHIHAGI